MMPTSSRDDRFKQGKALRLETPRETHADLKGMLSRDAVAILAESDRDIAADPQHSEDFTDRAAVRDNTPRLSGWTLSLGDDRPAALWTGEAAPCCRR